MSKGTKYILWFAQDNFATEIKQFRKAEVYSILKICGVSLDIISDPSENRPFWIVSATSDDDIIKVASRSFTLKYALKLWAHGKNFTEFHDNCKKFIASESNWIKNTFKANTSFRINVETFNKKLTQSQKIDKIETLDYISLDGDVKLKDPTHVLFYLEYYNKLPPNGVPEEIMLGQWILNGSRHLVTELSLKKRLFIGNTSMEPQLALLMSNQALVKKGDFVYDPFVGTGSILVAAAKLGAFVFGSDIDYLMIHGQTKPSRKYCKVREKDESIYSNLKQYDCEKRYIDVAVSDFSQSFLRSDIKFDSIITDPPYGIREACEKVNRKKGHILDADMQHYPSTSNYDLNNLYNDLLIFSVKYLKMRGRLVFWYPYLNDSNQSFPMHKSLILVDSTKQDLNKIFCRYLLTFEKISEDLEDNLANSKLHIDNLRSKFFY